MAGLTSTNRNQFRELFRLRRRLTFRQFRRRPGDAAAGIIIAIFTIPLPIILGVITGVAYLAAPEPWPARLLYIIVNILWVIWLLLPVLFSPFNEATDLRRLITYPIRPGVLTAALLAGALYDIASLFTAPLLLAILVGWMFGPAFLVVIVAVVLVYFHLVVTSQLVSTTLAGILHSRRFRDVLFITGTTLGLIAWSAQFWGRHMGGNLEQFRGSGEATGVLILEILRWTPPGACAEAITRATSGDWLGAAAWLGYSAVLLAVAAFVWWRILVRVTMQGGILFTLPDKKTPRDRRFVVRTNLLHWLPDQIRELVRKELKLIWRTPKQRMRMLQSILMPAVVVFFLMYRQMNSENVLWLAPPAFVVLVSLILYQNTLGNEGTGLAALVLSPLPRYKLFLAKELTLGLIIAVPLALATGFGLWFARDLLVLDGMAAGLAVVGGLMMGVNLLSIMFPVRMTDDDKRGLRSGQMGLAANLLYIAGVPLVAGIVSSPVWGLLIVTAHFDLTVLKIATIVFGVLYAAFLWWAAARLAGRVLSAREHQVCESLELGKAS